MDNLKRDNWTNEEVIAFLKDLKLHNNDNPSGLDDQELLEAYNTEAEELRRRFMRQHQQGVKAWNIFAESVEAARTAHNYEVKWLSHSTISSPSLRRMTSN